MQQLCTMYGQKEQSSTQVACSSIWLFELITWLHLYSLMFMCSLACMWYVLLLLQERALYRGVDVICATPGRLNDHLERGNFVSIV